LYDIDPKHLKELTKHGVKIPEQLRQPEIGTLSSAIMGNSDKMSMTKSVSLAHDTLQNMPPNMISPNVPQNMVNMQNQMPQVSQYAMPQMSQYAMPQMPQYAMPQMPNSYMMPQNQNMMPVYNNSMQHQTQVIPTSGIPLMSGGNKKNDKFFF
jgi:hypothetical protein